MIPDAKDNPSLFCLALIYCCNTNLKIAFPVAGDISYRLLCCRKVCDLFQILLNQLDMSVTWYNIQARRKARSRHHLSFERASSPIESDAII